MTKPRAMEWLEEQTGQELDRGRYLSLRVPADLAESLERFAATRGESVSAVARRLLAEGMERRADPEREAIDTAISVLESVRADLQRRTG